jgi:hypothetical protein
MNLLFSQNSRSSNNWCKFTFASCRVDCISWVDSTVSCGIANASAVAVDIVVSWALDEWTFAEAAGWIEHLDAGASSWDAFTVAGLWIHSIVWIEAAVSELIANTSTCFRIDNEVCSLAHLLLASC